MDGDDDVDHGVVLVDQKGPERDDAASIKRLVAAEAGREPVGQCAAEVLSADELDVLRLLRIVKQLDAKLADHDRGDYADKLTKHLEEAMVNDLHGRVDAVQRLRRAAASDKDEAVTIPRIFGPRAKQGRRIGDDAAGTPEPFEGILNGFLEDLDETLRTAREESAQSGLAATTLAQVATRVETAPVLDALFYASDANPHAATRRAPVADAVYDDSAARTALLALMRMRDERAHSGLDAAKRLSDVDVALALARGELRTKQAKVAALVSDCAKLEEGVLRAEAVLDASASDGGPLEGPRERHKAGDGSDTARAFVYEEEDEEEQEGDNEREGEGEGEDEAEGGRSKGGNGRRRKREEENRDVEAPAWVHAWQMAEMRHVRDELGSENGDDGRGNGAYDDLSIPVLQRQVVERLADVLDNVGDSELEKMARGVEDTEKRRRLMVHVLQQLVLEVCGDEVGLLDDERWRQYAFAG